MNPQTIKTENEKFLTSLGVAINPSLPLIESPNELKPRNAREIAIRSIVLGYVIVGVSFRQGGSRIKNALKEYALYDYCTPKEQQLLESASHTKQEQINCTWLTEGVQALAWCMGMVKLNLLNHCDDDLGPRFPMFSDPTQFISKAYLRPFDEIYREADLHYRAHWACRDAQLRSSVCPLQSSIVSERRRALDWTVGLPYDWDEIPLDT